MKSGFLAKLCHLKHQGKKQQMMQKIESWIDGNLDQLYSTRERKVPQRVKSKAEVMLGISLRSEHLQKAPSMTDYETSLMLRKMEFKKQLLEEAEAQLDHKLIKKQKRSNKHIQDNYSQMLSAATDFPQKQFFVDSNIEKKFSYFLTSGDKMLRAFALFNDGVVDSITKERE